VVLTGAGTELTSRCLVVRGAFGEATADEFDRIRDRRDRTIHLGDLD
jgi:hypothetical protein